MKVTVKKLIEDLSKFSEDAVIEIAVRQANKTFPIAYCDLEGDIKSSGSFDSFATSPNGQQVRLHISLPSDDKTFMVTSIRKY